LYPLSGKALSPSLDSANSKICAESPLKEQAVVLSAASKKVRAFSPSLTPLKRVAAQDGTNFGLLSSCDGGQPSSLNEELGIDSQQCTLESTDGHYTAASAFASRANELAAMRTMMFYHEYEPIVEENESKLSSQGDIRTDMSNTEESFVIDVHQYIEFCDEVGEEAQESREEMVMARTRSISLQEV